jgi:hypothetical protein
MNNDPSVFWYGERGIVNSIVTHIDRQPDPAKAVLKMLGAVEWGGGAKPAWVPRISNAKLMVEIGLADFGNPDLIIVCRIEGDERPCCVFVEAKAICYQFSMGSNSSGMSPGFNSTINGQISLKYRFAKALGNPESSTNEIIEPESIFGAYKKRLRDYSQKPRHLRKPEVLQLLDALGLMSLPEDRCCYVALTWDDPDHAFLIDARVQADNLPLLLDENCKEAFDNVKPRLGWLGYQNLEKALDLYSNAEYIQACKSMFPRSEPTDEDYVRLSRAAGMPEYDEEFLADLFGRFRDACGQDGRFFHKQYRGSYSLGVNNRTLAKLIPEGDLVFVGVRHSGNDDDIDTGFPVEKTVQDVVFRGTLFSPEIDSVDLDLYMRDILRLFAEMAAQTKE